MLIQRKWSIDKLGSILPVLIISLIVINIILISVIGFIYAEEEDDAKQADEYFRLLNQHVLLIVDSEGESSEEIISSYKELLEKHSLLDHRLSKDLVMNQPNFNNIAGQDLYQKELRENAAILKNNLIGVHQRSHTRNGMIYIFATISNMVFLILILIGRNAFKQYGLEMSSGLEYIRKILKFEDYPDFKKNETKIVEIDRLHETIEALSDDVSYNRKLMDQAVQSNLDKLLSELMKSFSKRMPCDRLTLAFFDSEGQVTAETAVTTYTKLSLEPGYREALDNTSLSEIVESGEARIINDLPAYAKNKKVSESTKLLLDEGLKSSITVPIRFRGNCFGFFFVSSLEKDSYNDETVKYAKRVIELLKQKIYIEFLLQEVIAATASSFVSLMEEKDNETSAHIIRMSQYSYTIARSYHEQIVPLEPRFMREILWFSSLHDIGKVATPDSILLKQGPLDDHEMTLMKKHVNVGMRVIERMDNRLHGIVSTSLLTTGVEIISGHHEKYNGKGYPNGLKGEEIPLAGRIAALADVFDALTSKRPYKEAYSIQQALDIIETEMAGSFDPDVVKAFNHGLPEIQKIYDEFKEI